MKLIRHLVLSSKSTIKGWRFRRTTPARSIAIDGYVNEGPWLNLDSLHANFNHHEGVDRLATRCTAAQLALAVRMGRLVAFFDGTEPVHV